jgi:predicted DNA-binding transcriptional regulator AlpA
MKMLRPLDCAKKIGVSRTTLHRWKKRPGFPVAFRLGDNSVAFDEDEIDRWLASRRIEPKAADVAAPGQPMTFENVAERSRGVGVTYGQKRRP